MPQTNAIHNVVYADDDIDDLDLVKDSFRQYSNNVQVITFKDGSQVLSYLKSLSAIDTPPCLIILDINMPIINGKDVLIRIRQIERYKSVPVVLFTTSSQPQDQSFANQYNAGFITKPLGIQQMEMITEQFIDHCAEEIRKNIRRLIQ
ncbi:MAG TPA: response regulator [Flavisolibacter sp.]|jgi:CheY-like chemotaxis protein|nr:response regulator [Flavisolibacter sp.]